MTSFGSGSTKGEQQKAQSRNSKSAKEDASSENRSKVSKTTEKSSVCSKVVLPHLLHRTRVLQSKHRMTTSSNEGLQLAPLRTLDDFIMGSARFQLPNFSDFEKWGNRVVKNLCYYQTNYLIVLGAWLVLTLIYQPKVAVYSTAIIAGSLLAARYCIQTYGNASGGRENLKYLLCTAGPALLLMYFMELILFVLFVILVPFCSELSLEIDLENAIPDTPHPLLFQRSSCTRRCGCGT